jgi:molybdopterin-guanine dinucleotide biosynthesis protein A
MQGHAGLTGVILAGGRSTRFGADKASALLRGRPLLQWVADALQPGCDRLIVVRARGQHLPNVVTGSPLAVVDDHVDAEGPLAGLIAGLRAAATPLVFVASCDTPLIAAALPTFLRGHIAKGDMAAVSTGDRVQPLCAVYRRRTVLPAAEATFAAGGRSLRQLVGNIRVTAVPGDAVRAVDPELASFVSMNTKERLHEVERLLSLHG